MLGGWPHTQPQAAHFKWINCRVCGFYFTLLSKKRQKCRERTAHTIGTITPEKISQLWGRHSQVGMAHGAARRQGQVKALATKPESRAQPLEPGWRKKETDPHRLSSDLHTRAMLAAYTHSHTEINR